ncbi:MAG: FkbM family methyltransferase [Thermodesulfobacteriota bacterium]
MPSLVESSRRLLRTAMPAAAYRSLARRYGAWSSARRIGFSEYRRLREVATADPAAPPVRFHPPMLAHPVLLRPGTTDALVFESNLAREAYACVRGTIEPQLIVDAGANVGFASAYFLSRFPNARVLALEPEPANLALATRNLAPYGPRVTLLPYALWHERTVLRVCAGPREDSARVEPGDGSGDGCVSIDPSSLLELVGASRIDLFKIDIEGAEVELFRHAPERWIEKTDIIVMEIHGRRAREVVYSVMSRHRFDTRQHRDLHVFVRARRTRASATGDAGR